MTPLTLVSSPFMDEPHHALSHRCSDRNGLINETKEFTGCLPHVQTDMMERSPAIPSCLGTRRAHEPESETRDGIKEGEHQAVLTEVIAPRDHVARRKKVLGAGRIRGGRGTRHPVRRAYRNYSSCTMYGAGRRTLRRACRE